MRACVNAVVFLGTAIALNLDSLGESRLSNRAMVSFACTALIWAAFAYRRPLSTPLCDSAACIVTTPCTSNNAFVFSSSPRFSLTLLVPVVTIVLCFSMASHSCLLSTCTTARSHNGRLCSIVHGRAACFHHSGVVLHSSYRATRYVNESVHAL